MMRKLLLILITSILISCNASILMTNGELTKPNDNIDIKDTVISESGFKGDAPKNINATKSYYTNQINVRWSSVNYADYYTIERCEHLTPENPTDNKTWKEIEESIFDTSYVDETNLEVGVYYTYRVKAHTFEGKVGVASQEATGTILSSPLNINASKGTSISTIDIEWEQMPNVDEYRIYKSLLPNVSGLDSEFVDRVQASSTSLNLIYSYKVDLAKEGGKELYFAIEGVGPTNVRADISLPRSGYTFVPGSPQAPSVPYITKADSTDSISIKFKSTGSDTKYIIKRYYSGSSETVIFSEEYGNTLPEADAEGYYTFIDTDVKANLEYTYSIIAYNEIGSSPATVVTGYILSPVLNIALEPTTRGSNIGYELSFNEPAGSSDSGKVNSYRYEITYFNKAGEQMGSPKYYDQGSAVKDFTPISRSVTKESELAEVSYGVVKVLCGALESSVEITNRIPMLSEPVTSISANKNSKPKENETPNSYGVYPVTVTWTSDYIGERVLTRKGSDGSVKKFNILSGLQFIDTTCDILVIYDYYIDTSDVFGRSLGPIMHTGAAYGAITPTIFANVLESVSMKPFENQTYVPAEYKQYWKKCKIAQLVSYGTASDLSTQMKALGSASDQDHFRGGTISYNASMEGVGGQIYFSYNSFGENENFALTGNYEMHVDASGTGSASSNTGGLTVSGMYPAFISLAEISVSKKAFIGSYLITYHYSDGDEEYRVRI